MSPDPVAAAVVAHLAAAGQHLATAESLTGGGIGAAITGVPGASAVYLGGVVAYATSMKETLAGVDRAILASHGPVSASTAAALATSVRQKTGADWGLAATGVAGPDPQDGHAPGEVWLAVVGPDDPAPIVRRLDLSGDRDEIRKAATAAALALLAERCGLQPPSTPTPGMELPGRGVSTHPEPTVEGQVASFP